MSLSASGVLAAPASTSYRLPWAVLDGGGQVSVSTNYRLAATFQSNAGAASSSTSYILASGFLSPPDTDADSVRDFLDNCVAVANTNQRDTDMDGFGNWCDPDFNGNGIVDPQDFSLLKAVFGQLNHPDEDLNGNGIVDPQDFSLLKSYFGKPPGPSGLVP